MATEVAHSAKYSFLEYPGSNYREWYLEKWLDHKLSLVMAAILSMFRR